jgi:hypothetical protein
LKEVPINIIPKLFIKCCLSNAQDGMQDDNSEQCGKGASSSKNKGVTEGSMDEL